MSPESAKEILLIKSLETSDRDQKVITSKARTQASKNAGIEPIASDSKATRSELSALEETRLSSRSRTLVQELEAQGNNAASYVGLRKNSGNLWLPVSGILIGAFLIGTASNYLGKSGVINLLAIPLLGLIAWNLLMYLIMGGFAIAGRRDQAVRGGVFTDWIDKRLRSGVEKKTATLDEPFRKAATNYTTDWFQLAAPARLRSIRIVTHLGAILMAAGVLTGMYLRGLGYEYKAGWQSTFLEAGTVQRWLSILLGPGSTITGIPVPPGDSLANLDLAKFPGEKADQWIHLFAATTALYIFVPRALFVVWEFLGLGRWRSSLATTPSFVSYYGKLVTGASGGGQLVRVLSFHCSPEPRHRDIVRGFIHQLWGGAAHVDFAEPAAYGEEDELLEGQTELPGYVVLLMSLSVTPEGEAHGFLISELQKRLRAEDEDAKLLLILDEGRFRQRFEKLPEFERRLTERRTAWNELVKPLGLQIGYFNSDDIESAEQLAADGERLVWSGREGSTA